MQTLGESMTEHGEDRAAKTPTFYWLGAVLLFVALVAIAISHKGWALFGATPAPVELIVYGFSTQEEAFDQIILPEFESQWEAENDQDLVIEAVFGPSGTLAQQILMGAPADVAIFSHARHATWLQAARAVDPNQQPATIGWTPMVIVTRAGNPAGIADFADLAQPGTRLIHAEPGESGAGDWAILAEYGSAYLANGDEAEAAEQLQAIWRNVQAMGSSARAALTLFELGAGDALVTYEQDARLALDRGVPLAIILPPRTIIAEHTAVVVDRNCSAREAQAANDLVHFLLGSEGQQMLAQYHMRPAASASPTAPDPKFQPFTVEDLGGWPQAHRDLVEGIWKEQIAPQFAAAPLPRLLEETD